MRYNPIVKSKVEKLRKSLYCINPTNNPNCNKQPIEWHCKEHKGYEHNEVGSLVAQGCSWERIEREIQKCTPLCRSCHMIEDGRLITLHKNKPNQPGTKLPPTHCKLCNKLYKPLRKGLCYSCYEHHRKNGRTYKGHKYYDGCCRKL